MDVESNPFNQVQPGGDVIPNISTLILLLVKADQSEGEINPKG